MRLGRKNNILGATLVVFAAIFALYIFTPNAEAGIRYGIARSACTALGGSVVLPDNGGLQVNCNVLDNPSDPTKAAQNDPGVASIDTGNTDTDFRCNLIIRFPNCVAAMVYWLFPGIGSYLAFIGAYFLGLIVQLSLDSSAYALQFLTDAWTVVRDIANMAFIFILIYIAFEIMLGAETAGTMRRLAWVIAIALIVNFSFFITRVVIDAGNILAVQFYNSIPVPAGTPGIGPGNAKDLSASIMNAVGVQKLYGAGSFESAKLAAKGTWSGVILFSVVSISLGLILYGLFFIFLQVGLKFLMRVVALWFVIIASPLALVSKTLKQTEAFYKTWQDYLIKFSFYPAIFLFMFLLLTTFLTQMMDGQQGKNIFSTLAGAQSAPGSPGDVVFGALIAGVFIRMAFVVVLLYVGLKAADWVVQQGNGLAQKATGWIGGAMSGVARFGGRQMLRGGGLAFQQGVGRGANRLANQLSDSRWTNQPGLRGWLGYRLRRNVVEPVTRTRVGGARSFAEFRTAQRTETRERGDNMRHILNREMVDRLRTGGLAALGPDETQRVENLSLQQQERLGADRTELIASHAVPGSGGERFWNDRKMRTLRNSTSDRRFNDAQQDVIYAA
ncbi:MAG: hypothetical protein UY83_C0001G0001, partial [Candidatus Adlerbacteria bacterium GW2011_GWA1_54_10]